MGTQQRISVGYGYVVKEDAFEKARVPSILREKIEEDALSFGELAEELGYLLIEQSIAGNVWGGPYDTVIVVKDTLVESYSDHVVEFNPAVQPSEDAVKQLKQFFTDLEITLPAEEPRWLVWSYVG